MIVTGLDKFLANPNPYKGKRIGLIVNHTSVTRDLDYSWTLLPKAGWDVRRIFSPEHGLYGTEQDQISVERQPGTDIELVSLYGMNEESLIPGPDLIEDLDLILFDVQDVGARYYTFVNTMALFLKALDGSHVEFVVLDRPNPLGGMTVEGPNLLRDCESFVGVLPVPVRHGMTAGELAILYRDHHKLDVDLSVLTMDDWHRDMWFEETGLPWVSPSPNMPTEKTAMVYPGLCLLEGTNISEGRGTTTPFELIGAAFIDGEELTKAMEHLSLPGITFRPMYFRPTFHKWADEVAGGVYLHVTDRDIFLPFLTGVALVKTIHDLYPEEFEFRTKAYEFITEHLAFDLLCGSPNLRVMIEDGAPLEAMADRWSQYENDFAQSRLPHLLY